uniref:Uncharacterized protein n=1 Tax=Anguilla anguilla TaxID=7936 RepID=A0A0E9UCT1_ANGAN
MYLTRVCLTRTPVSLSAPPGLSQRDEGLPPSDHDVLLLRQRTPRR